MKGPTFNVYCETTPTHYVFLKKAYDAEGNYSSYPYLKLPKSSYKIERVDKGEVELSDGISSYILYFSNKSDAKSFK